MPEWSLAFFVSIGVVLILTPAVIFLANKTGAVDEPDARKVHTYPIPRIGGVGIYLAFLISLIAVELIAHLGRENLYEIRGLLISGTLMFLVGLIDDYKNLPAKVKLLGQIIAAAILVVIFNVRVDFVTNPFGDFIYLEWLAIPATIFWLVGLTNTVNLIDGLDGLAAGVCGLAAVTIFLVAMEQNFFLITILTAALAGAAFGFLFYNTNPARIFMGDSGSLFLGFMLASISIIGVVKSAATIALIVPILALGIPILDTTFAILRRFIGGQPIFKPDKGHLHHRLLKLGFTQRQAVFLMYVISAMLGLSAIALTEVSNSIAVIILIVVIVSIIYGARKLGILRLAKR
ncbi:MAG: undecaprenyl/decaprenyl-phosphate alpha-N-acetylglucosaminyl 1-phosphate transferase [Selenomonadaceae bacterium]|nr:undecaprenyl/decaprenyl-phosphate alpha-N-acetylglucosaminyl 1-phosphate transferase [Selenomonadaceae bacterium]